jgi:hypothetical protein
MNILDEIQTIVSREAADISDERAELRIRDALTQLPDMGPLKLQTMRWFEYEISVCHRATVAEETPILTWLRMLDIAAAPELAASIPFGDQSCVLVRRYWACPGERLVIPNAIAGAPWLETARTRFRDDMTKIAAHGKVHPYARGFAHMYLGERTGVVLLNTWSVLKVGNAREQRDFLEAIDFQLQRRT